ncbi:MAG: VOC family protein [Rhizobiales bacterium]|nr:VOC family protein [Hyphomicrobiales bacterium]
MHALGRVTPILRIFDVEKALEFYEGFLGFELRWEHRYGDNFPLYMEVARGECVLHLSEHHGDAIPGSALRIHVADIAGFHKELMAKNYRRAKPGLQEQSWGTREVSVIDPFGNRLHFYEEMEAEQTR